MIAQNIPIMHSLIASNFLKMILEENYPSIGKIIDISFFLQGVNDTYLVHTSKGKYVLRIYSYAKKGLKDIEFELDFIQFLHRNGISVSTPIKDKNDGSIFSVMAPEGERYAVLFSFAKGNNLNIENIEQIKLFGQYIGKLHTISGTYKNNISNFQLDIDYLLREPSFIIKRALEKNEDSFNRINEISDELACIINKSISELKTVICHGDLHGYNFHLNKGGKITSFDFDFCGLGWRIYDLATFKWHIYRKENMREVEKKFTWSTFLDEYKRISGINANEISLIPVFELVRQIWFIGLKCTLSRTHGLAFISGDFFNKEIGYLNQLFQTFKLDLGEIGVDNK